LSRIYAVLRELGVVLMLATAVDYVLAVSPLVPKRWKLPLVEPFRGITAKARLAQNWPIMAPNPVANDGITVVDAVTIDGRHVDPMSLHREPFDLRAPDFDLPHARGLGFEQVWIDYLARVPAPWFEKTYKGALEDYLFRLPQRTGHPEDALVSADVYWVSATNPRWNETQYSDYDKRLVYSFKR
jgi:hypothetical protein